MPRCPVCQALHKPADERCSACGWDLQSYSFVTGLIPEVAQKEQSKLTWAKDLWGVLMRHREQITQLQLQIKEFAKTETRFNSQLAEALQVREQLVETLQERDLVLDDLQAELAALQAQLAQAQLAQAQLSQAQAFQAEATQSQPAQINSEADKQVSDSSDSTTSNSAPASHPAPASQPVAASHPARQTFQFRSLTVNQRGDTTYQNSKAECFLESLGPDIALEMVRIPGGEFWMGSPETEADREASETALHLVKIAPLWLSRFPITQRQWQAVAELSQIERSLNPTPSNFKGDDRPVEQVSWHDAIEFCARLSQITERYYRLPSEAEWEYACRAKTKTPFHFGPTIAAAWANYDGNYIYSTGSEGEYRQQTTPVDSFQLANAFGLSDMHGNVWEWCADPWHENYQGAPSDGSVWSETGAETQRVLRGGAWYCLPSLCRSAHRHWDQADHAGSGISFRVVCTLGDS
jgi:formylglycine-generating enzyme required for sulfatase activity